MEQVTPDDLENIHSGFDNILREAVHYDALFDKYIAGHPNSAGDLQKTGEEIIAEHEAAKTSEAAAAEETESPKFLKAARSVGAHVLWVTKNFVKTVRPPESERPRDYEKLNPDL